MRDYMVKASRSAKARVRLMSVSEKAQVKKAAGLLADSELITEKRFAAIMRTLK